MSKISIFYLIVVCMFFLTGTNVLMALHYPQLSDESFLIPSVLLTYILGIFGYFTKIKNHKYEFLLILLLIFILAFNFLTRKDMAFWALVSALLGPAIFSVVIKELNTNINKTKLRRIIYIFYIVNCLLAIGERLMKHCLFPNLGFETGFNETSTDFRSFALYGHPLSNSAITLLLMNVVLISKMPINKKIGMWFLGFCAILCFNSRFALVLGSLSYLCYIIKEVFFSRNRIKYKTLYIFQVLLIAVIISYLLTQGFGDRLTNMGLYDDDSAGARIQIFSIFNESKWSDFIFGLPYHDVVSLQLRSGTGDLIIENCWIVFLLRYGFIFLILMILAYIPLIRYYLSGYSKFAQFLVFVPWLINISSSNSLSAGGFAIGTLFLVLYTFNTSNSLRI